MIEPSAQAVGEGGTSFWHRNTSLKRAKHDLARGNHRLPFGTGGAFCFYTRFFFFYFSLLNVWEQQNKQVTKTPQTSTKS